MDKCPRPVIEAAKRIAKANKMSVREVLARYSSAVKKSVFSSRDFLLHRK